MSHASSPRPTFDQVAHPYRYQGTHERALVGLYAATEHLTVGGITLHPGQRTDFHAHGGDESLLVTSGTVILESQGEGHIRWLKIDALHGGYVPEGVRHRYWNRSSSPGELVFAVAPDYLP